MTCREKLKIEHPEDYESLIGGSCPSEFGYADDPEAPCVQTGCTACWDRQLEEVKKVVEESPIPTIKDSGDRTQFETGAVRDMREGKGRCDLMPLEVVAEYICDDHDDTEYVLWHIKEFLRTNSTSYLYGALDNFDKRHWNNMYTMFLEVAKHFEEGAKKYGPDNWKKGIPTYCYIDSAVRHYLKWLRGDKDEPHDRAFVWNLMCCIWEVDYHQKESEK